MKHEVGNPATKAEVSAVGTKVDALRKQFEGVFAKSPPEIGWKTESDLDRLQSDLDGARWDLREFEKWCGRLDAPLLRRAAGLREEVGSLQVEIATLRPEVAVRVALLREDHSAFKERIAEIRKRIKRVRKDLADLEKARTKRQDARLHWATGFVLGALAIAILFSIVSGARG